jgi:hypothetical protein
LDDKRGAHIINGELSFEGDEQFEALIKETGDS